jgi:hypothetical protein
MSKKNSSGIAELEKYSVLIREHLPNDPRSYEGDLAEILAKMFSEFSEEYLERCEFIIASTTRIDEYETTSVAEMHRMLETEIARSLAEFLKRG